MARRSTKHPEPQQWWPDMPYDSITELPDAVKTRYSPRCQEVFRKAFNRAMSDAGPGGKQDEATAMKIGHTAAGMCKDAGKAEGMAAMLPMKAAPLDDLA